MVGADPEAAQTTGKQATGQAVEPLDRPLVLLGRGHSGSRVLAMLALDAGYVLGSRLNESLDSLEMVPAVYGGVAARAGEVSGAAATTVATLRTAAKALIERSGAPPRWGFKLPESLLLLPEIAAAFPAARFAFIKRDPLVSAVARLHPTANPAQPLGAASLRLAARHFGFDPEQLAGETAIWRSAVTTAHQVGLALDFRDTLPQGRWFELTLERAAVAPDEAFRQLLAFLRLPLDAAKQGKRRQAIDPARALVLAPLLPATERDRVTALLAPLRRRLGYDAR